MHLYIYSSIYIHQPFWYGKGFKDVKIEKAFTQKKYRFSSQLCVLVYERNSCSFNTGC
uniref:Uncharacterized protein n=1 Tax=Octopus bimaculoides TaxID=37653 RepID=A0A0L8HWJ1_OCTBM